MNNSLFTELLSQLYPIKSINKKILYEIACMLPVTEEELFCISGIGVTRIQEYGKKIIEIIKTFLNKNNLQKYSLLQALVCFSDYKLQMESYEIVGETLVDICNSINGLFDSIFGYHINSKMLLYFLFRKGIVSNIIQSPRVTRFGKKYGFDTVYDLDNNKRAHILFTNESRQFISKHLHELSAYCFGISPFYYMLLTYKDTDNNVINSSTENELDEYDSPF